MVRTRDTLICAACKRYRAARKRVKQQCRSSLAATSALLLTFLGYSATAAAAENTARIALHVIYEWMHSPLAASPSVAAAAAAQQRRAENAGEFRDTIAGRRGTAVLS